MRGPGTPTLDQLQVFLTVVEHGGLTAAARQLGRATSAVSYAIDQLEAQLGIALFERGKRRMPMLTAAGSAVAAEARAVVGDVAALRAKVAGMMTGLEAELAIAVDVMLPTVRLVEMLQDFQRKFPTVGLRLYVEALGAVVDLVVRGVATIGVSGPAPFDGNGMATIDAGGVAIVPVAAPTHPLAGRRLTAADVRDHVQLVLTDRSLRTAGQDFAVIALKTWRLGDLGAKHALLLAGLGWGGMPEAIVADDLAAGRLVRLDIVGWVDGLYKLRIVHRTAQPPGPAGRWLIERLAATA